MHFISKYAPNKKSSKESSDSQEQNYHRQKNDVRDWEGGTEGGVLINIFKYDISTLICMDKVLRILQSNHEVRRQRPITL